MNDNTKIYVLYNLKEQKYYLDSYTTKKNIKLYLKEKRNKYVRNYILLKLEADKDNKKKEILHLNDNLLKMDAEICLNEVFNIILVPMQLKKFLELNKSNENENKIEKPEYYDEDFVTYLKNNLMEDFLNKKLENINNPDELVNYVKTKEYIRNFIDIQNDTMLTTISDFLLGLTTNIFKDEKLKESITLTNYYYLDDYFDFLYSICLEKTLDFIAEDLFNHIFKTKGDIINE